MLHPRLVMVSILRKARLNKIAHMVYYNYIHGFQPAGKELTGVIERCFEKAVECDLPSSGDYYEFGIFKGYSLWYAQQVAHRYGIERMRFFGFDSFRGLPEIRGIDKTERQFFYEGQYSYSKEKVIRNLRKKGVDWNRTFLIDGFFSETLNEQTRDRYKMKKVAVALIDCDLYCSTVQVLSFICSMLMDKTILIFDDWNAFNKDNERGQRRAFREFLESNREVSAERYFSYGLYGITFILKKLS